MCTFILMTGNGCSIHLIVLFPVGSVEEMELRLRKGDGTYRWFLTRCIPLRDEKGQIKRWYSASVRHRRSQAEQRNGYSRKTLPYAKKSTKPRCLKRSLEHLPL